jgi:hypothetical protein
LDSLKLVFGTAAIKKDAQETDREDGQIAQRRKKYYDFSGTGLNVNELIIVDDSPRDRIRVDLTVDNEEKSAKKSVIKRPLIEHVNNNYTHIPYEHVRPMVNQRSRSPLKEIRYVECDIFSFIIA